MRIEQGLWSEQLQSWAYSGFTTKSAAQTNEEKVAGRRSAERETLSLNVSAHVLRRDKLPFLCNFVSQAYGLIQL